MTPLQVACGSGLERICRFLQSDPCEAHLDHSPYVRFCVPLMELHLAAGLFICSSSR